MIGTTETREKRDGREGQLRESRELRKGKGAYINYYDDLGISTTEEGASNIREDETLFQEDIANKRGMLDQSKQELNKARSDVENAYNSSLSDLNSRMKEIPGATELVEDAWKKAPKVGVQVVNNVGEVEGTYYLSPEGVAALDKSFKGNKDIGYAYGYVNNNKNYNIVAWGGRSSPGGTLHEELGSYSRTYEAEYKAAAYESAAKSLSGVNAEYDSALGSINKDYGNAQGVLSKAQADYDANVNIVDSTVSAREAQWETLRSGYKSKIDNMKEILGNFSVEKGR